MVSPSETPEVAVSAPANKAVPFSITANGFEILKDSPSGDVPVTKKVPLFPALDKPEMVIRSPTERAEKLVLFVTGGAEEEAELIIEA